MLTRTLGSNSAAEGLFMFIARQRDGGSGVLLLTLATLRRTAVGLVSLRLACPAAVL